VGVCVGITPFNFPVMVPLWMLPMAIACGNTFVLKPFRERSLGIGPHGRAADRGGLPDGVLNVVHGDKAAVDALLNHPQVSAVSFVGSTPIAKYIYETCAKNGKRVQALGGAKNHAVVLPDADLEFAADALIGAAYGSAGERCMAISAVVAVGAAGDPLVKLLEKKAKAIKIGPGDKDGVDMGPLVTAEHRAKVAGFIEKGKKEGAKVVVDGANSGIKEGFFLGTTLFDHVKPEMEVYRNEIFGPFLWFSGQILSKRLSRWSTAIPTPTARRSSPSRAARRAASRARSRSAWSASTCRFPVPVAFYSFGGWKSSLFGDLHVHGVEAVKFYTRTKAVTTRWPHQDTPAPGFNMPTLG
jgi:malonate-semialdehyde dehydrogenase (acetylating)/methylmalonate-semialdehyde dehydrogenase